MRTQERPRRICPSAETTTAVPVFRLFATSPDRDATSTKFALVAALAAHALAIAVLGMLTPSRGALPTGFFYRDTEITELEEIFTLVFPTADRSARAVKGVDANSTSRVGTNQGTQVDHEGLPAGVATLPAVAEKPLASHPGMDKAPYHLNPNVIPAVAGSTQRFGHRPFDSPETSKAVAERATLHVAERLAPLADSVIAAAHAEKRARTWTLGNSGSSGWGVSPARIRLGGVTIPLQLMDTGTVFTAPAGRRDEYTGRLRTFKEIQIQAARGEGNKAFEERARAIRERLQTRRDSIR